MGTFAAQIPEVKIDDFKVVSSDLFADNHRKMIACTVIGNSLNFTKSSIQELKNCERIRIEINVDAKQLLIVSCNESDPNSVRWVTNTKQYNPRRIECMNFTKQLYQLWGWDKNYNYRTIGRQVIADGRPMLLYDFNEPQRYKRPGVENHG